MLKRKNLIRETKKDLVKVKNNDDILGYNINCSLKFSDLDTKSQNLLIREICSRILNLERHKGKI